MFCRYFKRHRSFRLVEDNAFGPPLCLNTLALAHTFPPNAVQFLPRASFALTELARSASTVDLPPTYLGGKSFTTLILVNDSDEPLFFMLPSMQGAIGSGSLALTLPAPGASNMTKRLDSGRGRTTFKVYPSSGVVPRRSHQLFCVEFEPRGVSALSTQLEATIAADELANTKVSLFVCFPFIFKFYFSRVSSGSCKVGRCVTASNFFTCFVLCVKQFGT